MKLKRILGFVLILSMILTAMPQLCVLADTVDAEPVIDIDFSEFYPGDDLKDIITQYVPDRGTIYYEIPEGYDFTALCFDDTYSSTSGPKMRYPFAKRTGITTIHSRLIVSNAFRFDMVSSTSGSSFTDGIRVFTNAGGIVSIENTTSDGANYLSLPVKVAKGEEVDIYMFFDFYGGYAHLCITSPTIAASNEAMPKGTEKIDGYAVVKNIPITIEDVGMAMYLPINGVGKSYIEFMKVYSGDRLPVEVSAEEEEAVTTKYKSQTVQPFKASWIGRPDTIVAYLNGYFTSETQRFGDDRIIPEGMEIDTSSYIPSSEKIEAGLDKYEGQHPRVLYTQDDYDAFKEKMETEAFADQKDKFLNTWCPQRLETEVGLDLSQSSVEQQYRTMGKELSYCSWAYKMTDNVEYANKAIEWLEFAFEVNDTDPYGYKAANAPKNYEGGWIGTTNRNLAAGQYIRGIADVYDRCYELLTEKQKQMAVDHLKDHVGHLCDLREAKSSYTAGEYLHNFGMCNFSGMLTAALAIYDVEPETARYWIDTALEWFANTWVLSGTDGVSVEGPQYWSASFKWVCTVVLMCQQFFDLNLVDSVPWLKNSMYWRLYASIPANSITTNFNIIKQGDTNTYSDAGSMEAYMYAFAEACDMPFMQWLADTLQEKCGRTAHYIYATWNPDAASASPEELGMPTLWYFDDLDYVSARSNWSGDESLIYFGCGSNIGKTGQKYLFKSGTTSSLGEGHSHPDANHFQLFGNGDFLLRDDGYVYKQTNSHNTLLVNGAGQKLEGEQYLLPRGDFEPYYEYPYIKKVISVDEYDYFVGCGANAYPISSGLERFNRHMLYLKDDDILIVIDDVKTLEEADLELRFFPMHETVSELDGVFVAQGPKNTMYIENLTPDQADMSIIDAPVYYKQSSTRLRNAKAFALKNTTDKMLTATAISWSSADETPQRVKMTQIGKTFTFTIGNKSYKVNTDNYYCSYKEVTATVEEPILDGVIINNVPLEFEDGVYDYEFNLDDYYVTADNSLTIKAIPGNSGAVTDISIEAPEEYPGTAVVTAAVGGESVSYNIRLTKTDFNVHALSYKSTASDINSDLNTFYIPTPSANEITFTLTDVKEVCGFEIAWMNSPVKQYNYTIFASEDGETYKEVYTGLSSTRATTMEYVEFDNPVSAKYLKLVVSSENDADTYYLGIVNFIPYRVE